MTPSTAPLIASKITSLIECVVVNVGRLTDVRGEVFAEIIVNKKNEVFAVAVTVAVSPMTVADERGVAIAGEKGEENCCSCLIGLLNELLKA